MKNINYFVDWIVKHASMHIHSQQDNLWLRKKFMAVSEDWGCVCLIERYVPTLPILRRLLIIDQYL